MSTAEAPVIACTLTSGAMKDRMARIAALNRDALFHHERDDLVLRLTYAPEASPRVQRLVNAEQSCCAFLAFDLQESPGALNLTITAPERARDAADALFETFLSGAPASPPAASSCACATTKRPTAKLLGPRAAGATAMTLSTGAVACGACCVLPFTLPAALLAGSGSLLSTLVHMHWWMTGLSVLAVVGAWGWLVWQVRRTGFRPATATLVTLSASTLFMTIALMWPLIEKPLIRALRV
ncbi:hypothetical protein S58_71480 [Bradyrhizobium oligotrophicum S58]|uniref:Uncharacterized protein n=1 Tax=Bradyrhizobium oligotrophicum S58 TaxID=1245469 RepID=M4ZH44_9BRAD|nr:hypothetical protein [Bradyrhizobium oligotrophicum]BAM93113.1 hypothetical protein S58_71480 [Bradyrhizobium oligotrophicum S58]